MKKLIIPFLILFGIYFLSGCTKWADDKSNIYIYQAPPPPNGISDSTPLCGSVKGTMLTGKTYTLGCTINVPAGDTLILQQGVTVNANISSGIIVHGTLISLGTQTQPNYLTVPGVAKNTTPNLPLAQDSAHVGLWKGIMCDTSCPMLVLKWTHLDFAGATYGNVDGPAVEQSAGTSFNILFQNILCDGHKNILFLMLVSWKIFFIAIITKAFELAFIHFSPIQFLDL